MVEFFNPENIAPPRANYSHGALVPLGCELLFVAGQLGIKPGGTLGKDFAEQAEWAFRNVASVLESKSMTPADIVKVQIFITDVENRVGQGIARDKIFGAAKPPSTLLVVKSLARPEFLIEVEAIAAREKKA